MDQQSHGSTNLQKQNSMHLLQLIVSVAIVLILFGALAYMYTLLSHTRAKLEDVNRHVTKLNGLSAQLDQVIKTGANDKILGFDKVNKDAIQAVFLTSGQVYFGKIYEMTSSSTALEKVYYLKDNNPDHLVKLGCEVHKPEDKLNIVRSNIQFWENLKADDEKGVTSAIKQYEAANPNGQKCS